jgi:CheY-like chemotaxis protein
MSNTRKDAYSVEVIGFNQTERIVLSSIFGLSARRQPKFIQHSTVSFSPDLFLVDASDAQAIALFNERNNQRRVPAIMIGENDHGTGCTLLARPLQWTRLFKAFDSAVHDNTPPPPPAMLKTSSFSAIPFGLTTTSSLKAVAPAIPNVATPAQATPPVAAIPAPDLEKTQPMNKVAAPPVQTTQTAPSITSAPPAPARLWNFPSVPVSQPMTSPPLPPTVTLSAFTAPPLPQIMPSAPLPAQAASVPAANIAASAPPAIVAPAPVAPVEGDWVLVVDDNMTVREFMKNKLAPFNFNVDYAESGEQAVGLTGHRRYTCVFLDVVMPGIDGYQVCKLIKSKKVMGKTAVVMLTSKGSPFDKIRGAMAGCDAYLTKPVDEEKLLETIVRFLPTNT